MNILLPCTTGQKQWNQGNENARRDDKDQNKVMKIRQKLQKHSHKNTPYTTRQKSPKQDKDDKKKSQKHKNTHSNIQYSNSYKLVHSIVPKNHTNIKKIPLIIK